MLDSDCLCNDPKVVTIDCTKWARGNEASGLSVNRQVDKRDFHKGTECAHCCLGFHAMQAMACEPKDLLTHGMPEDLHEIDGVTSVPDELSGPAATEEIMQEPNAIWTFAQRAAAINDDGTINDKTRILKLRRLAKKYGYTYRFINR